MKRKQLLLKISFILMLLIAAFHTFFILIGGPELSSAPDFVKMRELMRNLQIDSGGGVMRTMQNFMDGFNIIVSIFLFSLPCLSWIMLSEIKENERAIRKLTIVNFIAVFAFFITSLSLLAIGGTVITGLISLLLIVSLLLKSNSKYQTNE